MSFFGDFGCAPNQNFPKKENMILVQKTPQTITSFHEFKLHILMTFHSHALCVLTLNVTKTPNFNRFTHFYARLLTFTHQASLKLRLFLSSLT